MSNSAQRSPKFVKDIHDVLKQKSHLEKDFHEKLREMEQNREQVTSRVLQRFVSEKNPNEDQIKLGLGMLYLLISLDENVPLTNDKSTIAEHSWSTVQRHLSNQGKVLFNLKKIRDQADCGHFKYVYLQRATKFKQSINPKRALDISCQIVFSYLESTISYVKFVMKCFKNRGDSENSQYTSIKTPSGSRSPNRNLRMDSQKKRDSQIDLEFSSQKFTPQSTKKFTPQSTAQLDLQSALSQKKR